MNQRLRTGLVKSVFYKQIDYLIYMLEPRNLGDISICTQASKPMAPGSSHADRKSQVVPWEVCAIVQDSAAGRRAPVDPSHTCRTERTITISTNPGSYPVLTAF